MLEILEGKCRFGRRGLGIECQGTGKNLWVDRKITKDFDKSRVGENA